MINQFEILEQIKKMGFEVKFTYYNNDDDVKMNKYVSQYWCMPMENYKLQHSNFYYNGINDFVHFTSIEFMYSILNNRCMRLYNLANMDDKFEMRYALNELCYPEYAKFKKDKEEIFCFSMCPFLDIDSDEIKEHLLWKLYGANGNGVMLRFQFKNDFKSWYQYHISRVFYDTKNMSAVKELHQSSANNIFLDPKVSAFFKSPIYNFENEVRLVFDKREDVSAKEFDIDNNLLYPITYRDSSKGLDNIYYFELPLVNFHSANSPIYHAPSTQKVAFEKPKIEISEVILGYRYSEKQASVISEKVKKASDGLQVRITKLAKYY